MGRYFLNIASKGDASVNLDTLEWIQNHKTAVILEYSVVCGVIVGRALEDEMERIRRHANCVGILF